MALTSTELATLDREHRRLQIANMGTVGLELLRRWSGLSPEALLDPESDEIDDFLDAAVAIVIRGNRRSAERASAHYQAVRRGQTGQALTNLGLVDPPPESQVKTSLFVQGVVGGRKRIEAIPSGVDVRQAIANIEAPTLAERQAGAMEVARDQQVEEAMLRSGQAMASAGVRHTANGGRDQVKQTTESDVRTTGYVRVTSGDPCFFCAALASRGGVYKDDSFDLSDPRFEGPGSAKVHDSCACSLRPLYSRNPQEWPELNQSLAGQWLDGMTMLEWRQQYEDRVPD